MTSFNLFHWLIAEYEEKCHPSSPSRARNSSNPNVRCTNQVFTSRMTHKPPTIFLKPGAVRLYKSLRGGCFPPSTDEFTEHVSLLGASWGYAPGLNEYGFATVLLSSAGTSSNIVSKDEIVPPETPPLCLCAEILDRIPTKPVPGLFAVMYRFRVLFASHAERSEGRESYPHDGTMMAPVCVA